MASLQVGGHPASTEPASIEQASAEQNNEVTAAMAEAGHC